LTKKYDVIFANMTS